MKPDPKWLEILKASGWQTAAIAIGCGVVFAIIQSGLIASPGPVPMFGLVTVGVVSACLSVASMASALFRLIPAGRWITRWTTLAQQSGRVRAYIPHMTEQERQIIGYLLHHNQKSFTGAGDGGYATTLISRGIIVRALRPGQLFDFEEVPFAIPDHVWKVLARHRDQFPKPTPGKPYPWRVSWMVR